MEQGEEGKEKKKQQKQQKKQKKSMMLNDDLQSTWQADVTVVRASSRAERGE
jgi:hypothetical protein